jgi:hypothetical protein
MTNHQSSYFFLPSLNSKSRVRTDKLGDWDYQESVAFTEVADSLLLSDLELEAENVSSIPDMWARPLLMDMVLRDKEHPLHEEMKAEWKGMLAAIALAEVEGFKLQAELIELDEFQDDPFVGSLVNLIPSKEKALYPLPNKKNPWKQIYVFLFQGKPVGMTSPSTLVCTSEDGDWTGIPWFSNGKLRSPIEPEDELNDYEKEQMCLWLNNLLKKLQEHTGDSGRIKELISEYQKELKDKLQSSANLPESYSNNESYFGVPINSGALIALNRPIAPQKKASSVQLVGLIDRKPKVPSMLIIPEPEEITKQWGRKEKDIWIYETDGLVSFNLAEFQKKYKQKLQEQQIEYLTKQDIFLDDFYFIKGTNNLPGACLPEGIEPITYRDNGNEQHLTPLLPINCKFLQYFTPEEITETIIDFQPININAQSGIRVKLKLPLKDGFYTVTKDYTIREENAITEMPYLEVWPNFLAQGWQEYYAFYFDDRTDKNQKTFQVSFPSTKVTHPEELKDFQITQLDKFPSYIICQDKTLKNLGLILLKTPKKVGDKDPQKTWIVGFDRGTSFTNVYYRSRQDAQPLTLSPLHLQVTATSSAGRVSLMYEYFMSAVDEKLPIATVLTTKGNKGRTRPIFDGRIYIPENIKNFDPKQDDIHSDLKWSTDQIPYQILFLKHLALMINAEAATKDVKIINWTISYPSAFSGDDNNTYKTNWRNIIGELEAKTGIRNEWLPRTKVQKEYRSESVALAHYFIEQELEGVDIPYAVCIDMGGGTSDISVWQANTLIHQCSVQLAGKLLFTQFIKQKPKFLKRNFDIEVSEFTQNAKKDDPFYVKLDALLLAEGQNWLDSNRQLVSEDSDLQDIVGLSALGISGLYYYVGLLLKALNLEAKYTTELITPVYIGGNGSRILNWLAPGGRFDELCDANRLFSCMLSKASGFEDTKEDTLLSSQPKAEVACGLVLDQLNTKLRGLEQEDDDVIPGEDCSVKEQDENGQENERKIDWTSRLRLRGEVQGFEVANLMNLRNFVEEYHKAIQDLRIRSIKPLPRYRDEEWRKKLWKETEKGLQADCINIRGDANYIRLEPPFIIGLKSMLRFLATELRRQAPEEES